MALLRRTPSPDTQVVDDDADSAPAGKGRPTPKRSDSQKRRRQPPPTNRKEAEKLRRERNRETRNAQRMALRTGDERNLPARDAGPARRFARDIVDSRFCLGQFSIPMIAVLYIISATGGNSTLRFGVDLVLLAVTIAVVTQSLQITRLVTREVEAKFSASDLAGIKFYTFIRTITARRLRRPPPKVARGDVVK